MTGPLTVVGMDGARPPVAGSAARAAIGGARLAVGAARYLDAAELPARCERVELGALVPALERLRAGLRDGAPAVVLASGDPGFFGIVRRLRAEGFDPQVVPAPSSVAVAFARLGRSWDGAAVVSAHGRDLVPALNACRALPSVAVLTEPGAGATELGAGLTGWHRRLVVAERLGLPGERVAEVTPEQAAGREWAHPHVVVCLAEPVPEPAEPAEASESWDEVSMRLDNQPAAAPAAGWALPETAYQHRDSMITKAEVRALTVARLAPRLGRLIWDVGAASGSVGVECAALGAAVICVDADPRSGPLVRANAARWQVASAVRFVEGTAPEVLRELPAPDAVFVGGGGLPVLTAVADRRPARVVVTLAALDRVGPALDLLRRNGYRTDGVQLAASRLAELPGGSVRLVATNPVVVLTGQLP